MHHLHLLSTIIMPLKTPKTHHSNSPNHPPSSSHHHHHHHSPSATLDLLILLLVLFSGTFLVTSYLSHILHSLSLILPTLTSTVLSSNPQSHLILLTLFLISFVSFIVSFEICCGHRSRRCGKNGCKGLKNAMEFDLQLQGEEMLRGGTRRAVRDVDDLPWKGGSEGNPDYECLRAELRKMAPPNGRAVLLFRSKCGCPVAKLEGWGSRRGRRHKKSLALTGGGRGGGGDYR